MQNNNIPRDIEFIIKIFTDLFFSLKFDEVDNPITKSIDTTLDKTSKPIIDVIKFLFKKKIVNVDIKDGIIRSDLLEAFRM